MSIRVLVIGASSASLHAVVQSFSDSLDLAVMPACDHEAAARRVLRQETPEVAIVSSELVDGSGVELIASLAPGERPPAIVVVSRRDDDAVRAFELQATDFVREPVSPDRLFDALVRARHQALQAALLRTADELQRLLGEVANGAASLRADRLLAVSGARREGLENVGDAWRTDVALGASSGAMTSPNPTASPSSSSSFATAAVEPAMGRPSTRGAEPSAAVGGRGAVERGAVERVLDLAAEPGVTAEQESRPTRVLVREGRRTRFVPLVDVDWFEADGNYIVVRVGAESYRTRGTVSAIERVLDPAQFVRIHRRTVVNMDRVRELAPLPGGDGLLTLGDGSTLRLSRTYRTRVR
jgi:two-component system, LytTR family, response regulator